MSWIFEFSLSALLLCSNSFFLSSLSSSLCNFCSSSIISLRFLTIFLSTSAIFFSITCISFSYLSISLILLLIVDWDFVLPIACFADIILEFLLALSDKYFVFSLLSLISSSFFLFILFLYVSINDIFGLLLFIALIWIFITFTSIFFPLNCL